MNNIVTKNRRVPNHIGKEKLGSYFTQEIISDLEQEIKRRDQLIQNLRQRSARDYKTLVHISKENRRLREEIGHTLYGPLSLTRRVWWSCHKGEITEVGWGLALLDID